MQLIKLSRGMFAKVDNEDFEELNRYTWNAVPGGKTFYARRYHYFGNGTRIIQAMHRRIIGVTDSSILVDHEDRDGLNNQRYNLRLSNKSINAINSDRSDKALGIYYDIARGRYKVFTLNPRTYIGTFRTLETAIKARNWARQHQ